MASKPADKLKTTVLGRRDSKRKCRTAWTTETSLTKIWQTT